MYVILYYSQFYIRQQNLFHKKTYSINGQQYLKYFHPPHNLINLYFNGNPHKETIFNKLRLKNCKNNSYFFKIGASLSHLCDLCLQTDTVEHFPTECFKHSNMHSELRLSSKVIKSLSMFIASFQISCYI